MDKKQCNSCGKPKCSCKNKEFTKAVIEIDNPEQITLMRRVVIPASMGDDTAVPPVVGKYHNVLLYYEANHKSYLYSSDGIPTLLANGLTDYEEAVNLPEINGHTLLGDQTGPELGLQNEISHLEQYARYFDTVADMKASTDLADGDYARTGGFHSLNDGGGALYKITGTGDANEMDIIAIGSTLYANLIRYTDKLNVKQFGAYGDDSHDDTEVLQHCIDYAYQSKIKVITFPEGIYLISTPLEVYENKNYDLNFDYIDTSYAYKGYPVSQLTFVGSETNNSMIKTVSGDYIFNAYADAAQGAQDLTFKNLYFNGNNVAKSCLQMNIMNFNGRIIIFEKCNFNSFTVAGIEHWVTEDMVHSSPRGNNIHLKINYCWFSNNKNGLILGGDDTFIKESFIQSNEEFGIIIKGSIHNFNVQGCKIQYNGENKVKYSGGQILTQCFGKTFTIENTYFENKSSGNYAKNDIGVILFGDSGLDENKIANFTIKNCYINVQRASTMAERIGDCLITGLSLVQNTIMNIYSDKPYLFTTIDDLLTSQGISDHVSAEGNTVEAKTADGSASVPYYYLFNEDQYGQAGSVKTDFGVWSPNMVGNLSGKIPTMISGAIRSNGNINMMKIGDWTPARTDTGVYTVTFSRPTETSHYTGEYYPVFVRTDSDDPHEAAYVSNKSSTGFTVTTGTWDSGFTTFTPANKDFDFVAIFISEP